VVGITSGFVDIPYVLCKVGTGTRFYTWSLNPRDES